MEAISYSTIVTDADLALPAQPVAIPGAGAPGGVPGPPPGLPAIPGMPNIPGAPGGP